MESTLPSSSSSSSRSHTGLFHLPSSLKPFSALTSLRPHHGHRTTGTTTPNSHQSASPSMSHHTHARRTQSRPTSPSFGHSALPVVSSPSHPLSTSPPSSASLDPLVRVPSYGISSRGFLGGGAPPLHLSRDLPSYDEAASQRPSPEESPSSSSTNMTRSRSEMHLHSTSTH